MKWVWRGLVLLVVLLAVGGVVIFITLDTVAKRGLEFGASYATGVPTTVDSVHVSVMGGELGMRNLRISNPRGFDEKHFLEMGRGDVAVTVGSLVSEEVEVPTVVLDGITLTLEKKGETANYKVIMENLQKLSGPEAEPAEEGEAGKRFVVREILLTNVTVNLKGYPVVGGAIKLPTIKLTEVGSGGEGVGVAELTGVVIRAVFASLLESGVQLPEVLTAGLSEGMEQLKELGDMGVRTVGQVSAEAQKAAEALGKQVEGAAEGAKQVGERAGEAVGELGKGLGGLLGGKEEEEEQK